jgi:Pup amidohydrolase
MVVKKYLGRDCEFSTTGINASGGSVDSWSVARAVLRQIQRASQSMGATVWSHDSRRGDSNYAYLGSAHSDDCLRQWISNGQCAYCDLSHVEMCTATALYPRTFAAQSIATLLIAEKARQLAEELTDFRVRYELSASNADLLDPGISFGTHLSVSVSTACWENLFVDQRYPAVLGFIASVMAAAIPFFGAGYLLPMGDDAVIFSLSARAHHLARLHTLATTEAWQRGLLNSRREPHGALQERLHLIGFDNAIISSALMASLVQCSLAAAEQGYCGLNLRDPVGAVRVWSWNLDLNSGELPALATLVDGRKLSLPDYVRELAQTLLNLCEEGAIDEKVAPEAHLMLPRIVELAEYAKEGSLKRCAVHLDWAAKVLYLVSRGGRFEDAATRLADHDFTNTNPNKGAFWRLWEEGRVDPLVELDDAIECARNAPPESRDWARGRLIERFGSSISAIDWSYVDLSFDDDYFSPRLRVDFPRPDSLNRSQFDHIIRAARDVADLRDRLDACDISCPAHATEHNKFPPVI